MAIELCSENSGMIIMSPRISFSHDLSQTDVVPIERRIRRSISSSSFDFDFCVHERFDHESSSADELFSGGKMLPTPVKKKTVSPPPPPPLPPPQPPQKMRSSESDEKQTSKSFWRFKRSSSWNCGSGYARSLCPLPLLSRSNSTGSPSIVKRSSSSLSRDCLNHHKQCVVASVKHSQSSSSSSTHQRPPLKKTGYGSYGNGVRINPVLNVPSANFFGLGSIFSGYKDKSKKK